jgi:tetratricopeptide (TPR) repeat protein
MPDEGPSFWDWFRYGCLFSPFFWWVAVIAGFAAAYPLARRFQLWRAKARFIESWGTRLENPQNADARFQLAHLYAEGGSWRKALRYAEEAVRVAAENPLYEGRVPYHFLLLLGEALSRRRRYGEAADAFRRALGARSDLGHGDARFGLGKAYYRKGDFVKALEAYREALPDNASRLEVYFRLAQVAARLGHDREAARARAEFRRVAASLPRFARQKRLRWRLAFLLFPLTRWIA